MGDITAIFLTENKLPEEWVKFHRDIFLKAIGDNPIITISRKEVNLGINLIQTELSGPSNVYWQLLRGCKEAKTEYIAVVEDDTLYTADHFKCRPAKGKIGYNMHHWSLFTWWKPKYSWKNRRGNYSMIAERELVIECLEERFAKFPNGTPDRITGEIGRGLVERNLGITIREVDEFYSHNAIINFNHIYGMDDLQRRRWKNYGPIKAYDIPYWGPAKELVKYFK